MDIKGKILIVDDEPRMRKIVGDFLKNAGYTFLEAGDGEEGLKIFFSNKDIDLVLLDVMMPKLDGWETLKAIKNEATTPVIMLTARGEESDEVLGFKNGADDYIQKPFSPKILIARIEAVLRRNQTDDEPIEVGAIKIDKRAHQVFVDGKEVILPFKEFELLEYFIENKNLALTREKILSAVWDFDYYGDARTIDTHVKKLRKNLGSKGDYIQTIWGMGYKFEIC